jgi:nicotinamidase-related amidase
MNQSIIDEGKNVDQGNIALLVIDVQQGLFEKSTPIYKAEQLLQNINSLVERARRGGVPVFFIQHSDSKKLVMGSPQWQLHPRLEPQPQDSIIHKLHGNAFDATNLDETLRSKSIERLVITGLVTHGCVRATCLGARQLGYNVVLVKDAHSNYSKQAATIIQDWNLKLSVENIELRSAAEIEFSSSTS